MIRNGLRVFRHLQVCLGEFIQRRVLLGSCIRYGHCKWVGSVAKPRNIGFAGEEQSKEDVVIRSKHRFKEYKTVDLKYSHKES